MVVVMIVGVVFVTMVMVVSVVVERDRSRWLCGRVLLVMVMMVV